MAAETGKPNDHPQVSRPPVPRKNIRSMANQKEQCYKVIKQLKSNKMLKKALENEETKAALINSMYALIKEINEA